MKTVRVKQKKKDEDKKDWGGIIIGIFFLAFVVGAGYFVYDKFASIEVDEHALAGTWTVSTSEKDKTEYWIFAGDQVTRYVYDNNKNEEVKGSRAVFRYELVLDEGKTQKDVVFRELIREGIAKPELIESKGEVLKKIRFSKLSKVEADVFFLYGRGDLTNPYTDKSITARLTKPLF
ncbi:MAG: hypothetical protein K6B44_05300 [Lachnospiraceae bacterium]|nr:hypothetical protein [Lachnospiraceae bacterium]